MNKAALVSIVVPVFNGERYLAEAIESVLAQTYRPLEVIVVDDGSTDASRQVVDRFCSPVRYIFQPHQGPGAARNRGIEAGHGRFCAFLDADDLWTEDKLMRQMNVFASDPDLDMIFAHIEQFHSPELGVDVTSKLEGHGRILTGPVAGTLLIKRDSFYRAGPLEPEWRVGEFIEWYVRAVEKGLKSYTLPDVALKRRLHGRNMTIRERPAMVDYVRIIKASLDRRRNGRAQGGSGSAKA